MPTHQIPDHIAQILRAARIEGNILRIEQTLEPKTYKAVNAVLVNAGGKWDKRLKGHLFGPTGVRDLRAALAILQKPGPKVLPPPTPDQRLAAL